jgi:hypothetical protein
LLVGLLGKPARPVEKLEAEARHLRAVEQRGESGVTPFIAIGGLILSLLPISSSCSGWHSRRITSLDDSRGARGLPAVVAGRVIGKRLGPAFRNYP